MMRRILRWVFVLCGLVGLGVMAALPAAGQCSVRADWAVYTVARGDTLYSIARRFQTTATTLAQANCLANPNRIFVGQQLRVTPALTPTPTVAPDGSRVPEWPGGSFFVGSTYQQFENGFMTWRGDTGAIWVFFNDARVISYPLYVYGGLSGGARYMGVTIPPGRNLPTNGFKTVWDNFRNVREALGWAMGGEQGYDMLLTVPLFGQSHFTLMLPDGDALQITRDGRWSPAGGIPVPSLTPTLAPRQRTTGATFQSFENGFMAWRADNGEIRVFVGVEQGELSVYPAAQYGALPAGLGYPESGFGKVWNGIPGVRERMGGPMSSEHGYNMILAAFDAGGGLTSFSLPDGRFLTQRAGANWEITSGPVLPPA